MLQLIAQNEIGSATTAPTATPAADDSQVKRRPGRPRKPQKTAATPAVSTPSHADVEDISDAESPGKVSQAEPAPKRTKGGATPHLTPRGEQAILDAYSVSGSVKSDKTCRLCVYCLIGSLNTQSIDSTTA